MKPWIFWTFVFVSCPVSQADDWGSIHGQIVVEGEIPQKRNKVQLLGAFAGVPLESEELLVHAESKGLANVFFYLRKKPELIHPDFVELQQEAVELQTQNGRYAPHALLCRTGQVIRVRNADAVKHSVHTFPLRNQPVSLLLKANAGDELLFKAEVAESLPFRLTSDLYPWMSGYCLIVDHPYAAISDENGKFQIDNLPVGEHSFRIWHERAGYLERDFKVSVAPRDTFELPVMKINITQLQQSADVR
jgi:hypothetical protein